MSAEFLTADILDAPHARHGFFTRKGGVSEGIYTSLQCGHGALEDSVANVAQNRARAAAALGAGTQALVSLHQHHSADVITLDAPRHDRPKGDGMVTATPGVALGILTADCAPVLFHDPEAQVIGAAHAGWKGALGGVLEATITAMTALGARAAHIRAAIGPCISQQNYQVDGAYRARFIEADPANAEFFLRDGDAHYRFDLPGFCAHRLREAGISHIDPPGLCTYADAELFYSNRRRFHRNEPDYGRGLSAIMLVTP